MNNSLRTVSVSNGITASNALFKMMNEEREEVEMEDEDEEEAITGARRLATFVSLLFLFRGRN